MCDTPFVREEVEIIVFQRNELLTAHGTWRLSAAYAVGARCRRRRPVTGHPFGFPYTEPRLSTAQMLDYPEEHPAGHAA